MASPEADEKREVEEDEAGGDVGVGFNDDDDDDDVDAPPGESFPTTKSSERKRCLVAGVAGILLTERLEVVVVDDIDADADGNLNANVGKSPSVWEFLVVTNPSETLADAPIQQRIVTRLVDEKG